MAGAVWLTAAVALATTACGPSGGGAGAPSRSSAATGSAAAGTAPAGSPTSAGPTAAAAGPTGHQPFTPVRTDVGRLLVTRLTGPRSGVTLRVWVWLPPQYDQPAYAHAAFLALMLYPGGSGAGYNTWSGRQYGAREADAAGAASGGLTPFVFVMPEMQLSERRDTECADLPGQPKVGTFLAVDVRRMIEDNFRVLHDRTGWAAAGASSGAYCAVRLVFNHPDQYGAAASISGYFALETTLPGGRSPALRAQDPAAIAASAPPPVSLLLWAGAGDPLDVRIARGFLALVRPPTRAELRILSQGRHLTSDFAKMMPGTLAFLSAHLAHPAPAG